MRPPRLAAALLLFGTAALAEDRPTPEWVSWKPRYGVAPLKAFVAVGRSGETGPDDYKGEQAEDDARQKMGELVADWQERTLACARKASESSRSAKSRSGTGASLAWELQSETTVSFYRDRVVDRAYEGRTILVLLRHELAAMIDGVTADASRSAGLREAVGSCGEKAFDGLSAR